MVKENLGNVSTKELTEEITGRAGVKALHIEPYQEAKITTGPTEEIIVGPAIILINQD